MFRALAVLSTAVWLALAPATVDAATSSHKAKAHSDTPHKASAKGKGHSGARAASTDEAPSHKARLRHGGDAEATPAKGRGKASRRHATAETADATPAETRHGRRKGRAAAGEDAPAAATKASHRSHAGARKTEASAEPEPRPSARHSYGALMTPSIRRAEAQAESACEAAKAAKGKGRRRKSAKARAAAYASCMARAHAAARRAAEEEAERVATWTPTRGPIVYAGAVPRGPQPYAAPTPDTTTAPTTATPGAAGPAGGATTGAATVQQPPATGSGGGFLGGLFRRRNPPSRPAGPAPTLASLIGADEARLKAELGDPDLMRAEGGGALWTYRLPNCALYVFLSRAQPSAPWQVKGAQTGPLKRGQTAPEADACLKAARP